MKKGGVTVYVNELVPHKFIEITNEIEAVAVLLPEFDCIVIILYYIILVYIEAQLSQCLSSK